MPLPFKPLTFCQFHPMMDLPPVGRVHKKGVIACT